MVKISKKLKYALEAVLDISYNSSTEPTQSREITYRQGIPQRYLEQVMQRLVRAGLLKGVRGPRGGYRLARERRRITVGDIARIVHQAEDNGKVTDNRNSELASKVVLPMWKDVEKSIMKELDSITLDDLCKQGQAQGVVKMVNNKAQFDI